ncbi:MAG: hypothetical protein ACFFA4_03150 [Promethearchaeota archaeon]
MYCPTCNMNVYTKPNDFNIGLAIILAIFTGGIGLLIYVAIYLDKSQKPRCIHCNSICYSQKEDKESISKYQIIDAINQPQSKEISRKQQQIEEKPLFCFNCGSELDNSANAKFCALCGTSIQ